jgi:hypothetical protein
MFRLLLRMVFGGKRKEKKKSRWAGPVLAVFVLIGLLDGGKAVVKTVTHKTPSVPSHGSVHSGTLDCTQLEELWEYAGGAHSKAFLAAEVARAESSGHQWATDDDGNGSVDEGYWQINTVHSYNLSRHGLAVSYDPLMNAKDAVYISNDGTDWSAWVTYNKGAEVGQC